jgi:preprotein translocase subunit SecY
VVIAIIPMIVYIERGQRRIPVQYAKRVVGRRMMGGQATYLPIKVNTAGVVPIIFASALLYIPAQVAIFFPNVGWVQAFANAISTGWINWILSVLLIVFFAYFYTSMVFNPDETADQLRKAGGFIPGVRPGGATAAYIKNVLDHITLPGALFMAALAVIPSILFAITGNTLMQAFGGTSVLILVGVAMDTISQLESQLKMHNYEGFFK